MSSLARTKVAALLAQWPTEEAALARFNPSLQHEIQKHSEQEVFLAPYPTLTDLRLAYGDGTPSAWLAVQLDNMNEYAGVRDKLTEGQLRELSILIAGEYGYLKVSELMLFFVRFKMGRYGQFYGNVDPLKITTALGEFIEERRYVYDRREQEENYRRMMESSGPTGIEAYRIMLERKKKAQKATSEGE